MRLDHLLSREIRVSILGGIEALMAPTVDRAVDRFPSQVGSAGARKGGGDRSRPGENHRTRSSIRLEGSLSLFQGQGAARVEGRAGPVSGSFHDRHGAGPGGRLAQLVRALP